MCPFNLRALAPALIFLVRTLGTRAMMTKKLGVLYQFRFIYTKVRLM